MKDFNRREFFKTTAAAAAAATLASGMPSARGDDQKATPIVDELAVWITVIKDESTGAPPVQLALERMRQAFKDKKVVTQEVPLTQAGGNPMAWFIVGSPTDAKIQAILKQVEVALPEVPESLAIVFKNAPMTDAWPPSGVRGIVVTARDARGYAYALLELADRVELAADLPGTLAALNYEKPIVEKPANKVRGIVKMFASELDDKPWLYDQTFWTKYLDMLAAERFNRFNLSFGLAYDFARNLTDTYGYFAYPFLVNVPGYNVRAIKKNGEPLAGEEQKKNLEALKFVADECAKRGIDFFLGLWTHAFVWENSPNATYTIDGLTNQSQGNYSRDALHLLLDALPNVKGVTIRTHGESGVAEGNVDIWKTILSGVSGLKTADGKAREVRFDLHGKSITTGIIDAAGSTGMPVEVSCKFWAEHCGLPYIQARVRDTEMAKPDAGGLMSLSSGSRNFLRYGFGDLLTADRKYGIVHRLWHGTQRVLLWGDPKYAAEYARLWNLLGSDGADYFEPLTFKGRCGTHVAPAVPRAGRTGYAKAELVPAEGDWTKYLYTYRLWGRTLYNPDCDAEVWRRQLRSEWGVVAAQVEAALAAASRILPCITTAHEPSASNANYWPENYLNMSLVDAAHVVYTDCPTPHIFGTVSPLDPQMFASCDELAAALLAGRALAKVNPVEVAEMLDGWAGSATSALVNMGGVKNRPAADPAGVSRARIDVTIAAGIAGFFANKFRAAVLFAIYQKTGVIRAREEAVAAYKKAREAWAGFLPEAAAYVDNLSYGGNAPLHGHWKDRLPGIDADIQLVAAATSNAKGDEKAAGMAIDGVVKNSAGSGARAKVQIQHMPPKSFKAGEDLVLVFGGLVKSVRLVYRHVNQGENWVSAEMKENIMDGPSFEGVIPGAYTKSPFGLQYYFELETADGKAGMFPGFKEDFAGTPYFVVGRV